MCQPSPRTSQAEVGGPPRIRTWDQPVMSRQLSTAELGARTTVDRQGGSSKYEVRSWDGTRSVLNFKLLTSNFQLDPLRLTDPRGTASDAETGTDGGVF